MQHLHIQSVLDRALQSRSPEALLVATVLAFLLAAALVLRLVPIHDSVDGARGAIVTDIRPTRLVSEDQYRISRVFHGLGDAVRRGDPLVQFDGGPQRIELAKLAQELDAKQAELAYDKSRLDGVERKLELTATVIEQKQRLAALDASHTRMAVVLDEKQEKAARQLRALSERIVGKIIPALDTRALSEVEKAKVLSNANADLRQMYQFAAEVETNRHKAERDNAELAIAVADLESEQVGLRLSRADIVRATTVLQGEIDALRQEHAQLEDQLTRLLVRAPVDGTVIRVAPELLDSNLVERNEELFLIQPQGSRLEAELVLTDEQFRDARVGQKVNLELYAWNHYRHGAIDGRITAISASKIMPQVFPTKDPHFIAKVRLVPGRESELRAGYNLEATIVLGEISLFDYVLKKLRVQ